MTQIILTITIIQNNTIVFNFNKKNITLQIMQQEG